MKRYLSLFLVLAMMLSLVACTPQTPDTPDKPDSTTEVSEPTPDKPDSAAEVSESTQDTPEDSKITPTPIDNPVTPSNLTVLFNYLIDTVDMAGGIDLAYCWEYTEDVTYHVGGKNGAYWYYDDFNPDFFIAVWRNDSWDNYLIRLSGDDPSEESSITKLESNQALEYILDEFYWLQDNFDFDNLKGTSVKENKVAALRYKSGGFTVTIDNEFGATLSGTDGNYKRIFVELSSGDEVTSIVDVWKWDLK